MAERLRSVLRIVQLRLILKAVIFAGLLFWVKFSGFSVLPVFLFVLINLVLYFRGRGQSDSETTRSLFVLLFISLFGVSMLSHVQFLIPAILFFSLMFYLISGIRGLVFVHRGHWNYVKNILLLYSIFLTYFLSNKYDWFFAKYLLVFVLVFLLIREWLSWLERGFPKRRQVIALVLSFLTLQLLWAVSLLPLGFIDSATLMTVFVYVMLDFCMHHFKGTVNKELILKNSVVTALSLFIVFIFTNWKV